MTPARPNELTAREAAAYCHYTPRTFYIKVCEIPHRKERRRLFFKVSDLDAFVEAQRSQHVPV